MRDEDHRSVDQDSVCCLSCRHVYAKPAHGGTASRNPGCPRCGYVGWLSILMQKTDVPAPPGYGATTTA